MSLIDFFIAGYPYAKQSARVTKSGHVYQTKHVKEWQQQIVKRAGEVYKEEPSDCELRVELIFCVHNLWGADIDNLTKAVLDGLQGVIYKNDRKVLDLHVMKIVSAALGVRVRVWSIK